LAAIVAERAPDGPAALQIWLKRLLEGVDQVPLNDEKSQPLPPELEAEIRGEIRKRFEALSAVIIQR
jgi:hypothetical protein